MAIDRTKKRLIQITLSHEDAETLETFRKTLEEATGKKVTKSEILAESFHTLLKTLANISKQKEKRKDA